MEHIDYIQDVVVFEGEKEIGGRPQKIIVGAVHTNPENLPDKTEEEIIDRMREDIGKVNKLLPGYKRLQDLYLTTEEFEINSTRKVIRQKVIDRYYASIK